MYLFAYWSGSDSMWTVLSLVWKRYLGVLCRLFIVSVVALPACDSKVVEKIPRSGLKRFVTYPRIPSRLRYSLFCFALSSRPVCGFRISFVPGVLVFQLLILKLQYLYFKGKRMFYTEDPSWSRDLCNTMKHKCGDGIQALMYDKSGIHPEAKDCGRTRSHLERKGSRYMRLIKDTKEVKSSISLTHSLTQCSPSVMLPELQKIRYWSELMCVTWEAQYVSNSATECQCR